MPLAKIIAHFGVEVVLSRKWPVVSRNLRLPFCDCWHAGMFTQLALSKKSVFPEDLDQETCQKHSHQLLQGADYAFADCGWMMELFSCPSGGSSC